MKILNNQSLEQTIGQVNADHLTIHYPEKSLSRYGLWKVVAKDLLKLLETISVCLEMRHVLAEEETILMF